MKNGKMVGSAGNGESVDRFVATVVAERSKGFILTRDGEVYVWADTWDARDAERPPIEGGRWLSSNEEAKNLKGIVLAYGQTNPNRGFVNRDTGRPGGREVYLLALYGANGVEFSFSCEKENSGFMAEVVQRATEAMGGAVPEISSEESPNLLLLALCAARRCKAARVAGEAKNRRQAEAQQAATW